MVAISAVLRRRRRQQRCHCLESDYPDTRAAWTQTPSSAPRPRATCSPSTESTSATPTMATVRCHDVCLFMPCSLSGSELIHHPQRPVCASLPPFLHTIPFHIATLAGPRGVTCGRPSTVTSPSRHDCPIFARTRSGSSTGQRGSHPLRDAPGARVDRARIQAPTSDTASGCSPTRAPWRCRGSVCPSSRDTLWCPGSEPLCHR
jgi:hypothetical protein